MYRNKLTAVFAAVAMAVSLGAGTAQAASLEIQFSGLNLLYLGDATSGAVCDATDCDFGVGDPSQSDPLVTMSFLVDGNTVGLLTTNIWADIALFLDDEGIPAGGGTVNVDGGVFDLLTQNALPGWGLALDVGSGQLTWTGSTLFGSGTGSIFEGNQNLPFGLRIGQPITWSFSSQARNGVTSEDGFLTRVATSGTGEVIGAIPEPASLALLGMGLFGFGAVAGRRRRLER